MQSGPLNSRRVRQGYTIDELQAGALSSDDNESDNAFKQDDNDDDDAGFTSSTIVDTATATSSRNNGQGGDDGFGIFLDEQLDVENEAWVHSRFVEGSKEARNNLCCPGCFKTAAFTANPSSGGKWETSRVVHCVLRNPCRGGTEIACADCGAILGYRRTAEQTYVLDNILPSTLAGDDL